MKVILLILCALYFPTFILAQTSISQGFEGAAGLNYTAGTINTEQSRTGSKSLRLGRGATCSATLDDVEVIFDPIYLIGTACPGTFRFYHRTGVSSGSGCGSGTGMDTREGFAVYVKLNGAAWTLISSISGFNNLDWNWGGAASYGSSCGNTTSIPNPFVYTIPGSTTFVQFKIITIKGSGANCSDFSIQETAAAGSNYDRGDEGLFIDDVSFSTIGPCTLPIELLDFSGIKNGNQTLLSWKVAEEKNIKHYSIEKSVNAVDFYKIGTVMANGMDGEIKNYSYIDDNAVEKELVYYRLSSEEKNGIINTHKIISIDGTAQEWAFTHHITDDKLIIDFKNSVPKNGEVDIVNLNGLAVASEVVTGVQSVIEVKNLAEGIYFVKINSEANTKIFKIIIQH